MAYKITDACVKCGSCADNCPVEAISEGDELYIIDADICVDCGSCADNCPTEAIVEGGFSDSAISLRGWVLPVRRLIFSLFYGRSLWNSCKTALRWNCAKTHFP